MAPTLREDIVTLTPDLVHEAVRRFTAADGIFAVTERQVAGVPRRVFTHAAPTVLDILTSGRGHGGADFLVFGDRRWSFEQFFADVDALAAVLQHLAAHPDEARAKAALGAERVRTQWTWDAAARIAADRLRALRAQPAAS